MWLIEYTRKRTNSAKRECGKSFAVSEEVQGGASSSGRCRSTVGRNRAEFATRRCCVGMTLCTYKAWWERADNDFSYCCQC
jgi:hypothetical protein